MKRGFSRMIWGGIILLVVLFFVGVYGVKEGFACKEDKEYPIYNVNGKKLTGCYSMYCVKSDITNPSNGQNAPCYSGTASVRTAGDGTTLPPSLPKSHWGTYSSTTGTWSFLR